MEEEKEKFMISVDKLKNDTKLKAYSFNVLLNKLPISLYTLSLIHIFLEFVCSAEKHKLFRNPIPGDIILAVPFLSLIHIFVLIRRMKHQKR